MKLSYVILGMGTVACIGIAAESYLPPEAAIAPVTLAITIALTGIAAFATMRFGRASKALLAAASGDLDATPPKSRWAELQPLADAVALIRERGGQIEDIENREAEHTQAVRDAQARTMQALQRSFGHAVEAGVAGDFSRRVNTDADDAEIVALASSVNRLLENVERNIHGAVAVLSALARHDLTMRIEGDQQGAFATLRDDTNALADMLTNLVGQLQSASGSLTTATGEILAGSNDLSERSTRQAAAIEETSAAMEQILSTVKTSSETAKQASQRAATVTTVAERGSAIMTDASAAMVSITESSSKIATITDVIDDIAFQTNLLALNASVEAARAGEAGKGFAVVAIEVRRLAQSASAASADIKSLIAKSTDEVRSGTELVKDAAAKLTEIISLIHQSEKSMADMASASREQETAITEVSTAIREMDEMTQHNAALVEETGAAIEQTEGQVTALDKLVAGFKLDRAPQRKVAAPRRAA